MYNIEPNFCKQYSLLDYNRMHSSLFLFQFMISVFLCNSLQNPPSVISGVAGGLTNLAKMPACNLMLLGAQRRTLSGFSSTSLLPHTGYIYHCDVVQTLPPVSNSFFFT